MNKLYLLLILIPFVGCKSDTARLPLFEGVYGYGEIIKDSLFNGNVVLTDSTNKMVGFRSYSYGLQDGPSVQIRSDGSKDSLNFKNDYRNGYAYNFDSSGLLRYKTYYHFGRNVGGTSVFNKLGKFERFFFYDLEGKLIYERKILNNQIYERGDLINLIVEDRLVDGKLKMHTLLYIIDLPDTHVEYSIGVLSENDSIISSKRIESDFYYETFLEALDAGKKYAIICDLIESGREKSTIVQPIEN